MRLTYTIAVLSSAVLFGACGGSDHGGRAVPPGPTANVQLLHAAPDAPPVVLLVDGTPLVRHLDYGEGTGEITLPAGTHSVELQTDAAAGPVTLDGPTTVDLQSGSDYVFVAEGRLATPTLPSVSHVLAVVPADSVRVQFLHAAPAVPAVDVHVTAPGAALSASTAIGTLAFGQALAPSTLATGTYEIRLTPAGSLTPVLFDSGTVSLPGGSNLAIAALEYLGPGASGVYLSATDAFGQRARLLDVATPAEVRLVNDLTDVAQATVTATTGGTSATVSAAYGSCSARTTLPGGLYAFAVASAGAPATSLAQQSIDLDAGDRHLVFAIGTAGTAALTFAEDNGRRYGNLARVRLINGSSYLSPVDAYFVAHGTALTGATPIARGIPYGGDTGYVSVGAGSYDLVLTAAGSTTPIVGPYVGSVATAGRYTLLVTDGRGTGGSLALTQLDDVIDFGATPLPACP